MLRLLRDRVHIAIYRDSVVLARVRRGWRRDIVAQHAMRCGADGAPEGLAALAELLRERRWQGADASVLVSNALVRYTLVPAGPGIVTATDELDLARHRIESTHGTGDAAGWQIRLGNPLDQRLQPAAALPGEFVARLLALLKAARLRPLGIEPFFMHAWNTARARLRGQDFWFANAEPDGLLLARVRAGQWTSLAVRPIAGSLREFLLRWLNEATLLAGEPKSPAWLYLHAPAFPEVGEQLPAPFQLVQLCPPAGSRGPDPALALRQVLGV